MVAGFNAVAALGGAIGLATGVLDFGPVLTHRLPFDSVVFAGAALFTLVAVPLAVLAWAAWVGWRRTDDLALGAGVMLIGWILVQLFVLQALSFFHPTYLAVGVYFVAASHRVRPSRHVRGVLLVGLGALIAAVGIGLLPHVTKNPRSVVAVLSVVLIAGGVAVIVVGTRSAMVGRRALGAATVVVAAMIATAVIAWLVAPPVAATIVAPTSVEAPPASIGLTSTSVTVVTADGVALAGWFLPGTNGAGVVVAHGAGSTRSDVLAQAGVLVDAGYSVLLLDARGHGDSGGTAMDFGWYGDLDLVAGIDYLAAQPGIDAGRLGVVGFSMGGEEAIGAAAADPRIRAVVAEGATGRQAADKAWYADTYGWRGWIQWQFEKAQTAITDLLTDSSAPTPLPDAVRSATNARFLLITAATVADEGNAAAALSAVAPERVTTWNVEGATHTGGFATQPDAWRTTVIGFLDANLA